MVEDETPLALEVHNPLRQGGGGVARPASSRLEPAPRLRLSGTACETPSLHFVLPQRPLISYSESVYNQHPSYVQSVSWMSRDQ